MNTLARRVLDAAIEVHRHLGPGHAESVYENALAIELELRGLSHRRQAVFHVTYKGKEVGEGRTDLLVERLLIVELKAVEHLTDLHVAQAISYLKATGLPLALLINFNVALVMQGVRRVALNGPAIPADVAAKGYRTVSSHELLSSLLFLASLANPLRRCGPLLFLACGPTSRWCTTVRAASWCSTARPTAQRPIVGRTAVCRAPR